ncbi:hypothetical protein I5R46_06575 [Pseudomonas aeruginosa]|nr:hypothetical protein [Pseudomonas aeruginosa]
MGIDRKYDKIIEKAIATAPKPADHYLNHLYRTVQLGMIESLNNLIFESNLQRNDLIKLTGLTEKIYEKAMKDIQEYKNLSYETKRDQLKERTSKKLRIATFLYANSEYDENNIKSEIHTISVYELARLQKKPVKETQDDYLLLTSGLRKQFIEKYGDEISQIQKAALKRTPKPIDPTPSNQDDIKPDVRVP